MRLMSAGQELESLLACHADDIDETLLEMLYARIQVAARQEFSSFVTD